MDWTALLKTLGLCLISIAIEAISYTKDGKKWFEDLKRPLYSLSLQAWYFVGAVYYILFGIIAYRQFHLGPVFSTSILLLVAVMVINGLSNFIIFKYRSLKWFYLIIYPFGILLLALILALSGSDTLSAGLASIYFLWLIYDLYYAFTLWKHN